MNRSLPRIALCHAVLSFALALFAVPASAQTVSADGYISLPGGPVETLALPRFTYDELNAGLLRDNGLVFVFATVTWHRPHVTIGRGARLSVPAWLAETTTPPLRLTTLVLEEMGPNEVSLMLGRYEPVG